MGAFCGVGEEGLTRTRGLEQSCDGGLEGSVFQQAQGGHPKSPEDAADCGALEAFFLLFVVCGEILTKAEFNSEGGWQEFVAEVFVGDAIEQRDSYLQQPHTPSSR